MKKTLYVIKNLTLLLAALSFLSVSVEVFYRWKLTARPFEYKSEVTQGYVFDSQLGYRIKREGFNGLGLRGPEVLPKENQFRILLLGDSVLYGFNANLLKEKLKASYPQLEIEIINASVPGYTTKQELDFLKIYGLDMEPDLVVLGFVLNDIYAYLHRPAPSGEHLFGKHPHARLTGFGSNTVLGKLFYRSYFAHDIVRRLSFLYKKVMGYAIYDFEKRWDFRAAWKDFIWDEEAVRLKEMRDVLKAKNIEFAIACFPVKDQMREEYINKDKLFVLKPQLKLKEICKRLDVPLLDLWNTYYQNREKHVFKDYLHPNQLGYVLFTDKLVEFIREEDLIPS